MLNRFFASGWHRLWIVVSLFLAVGFGVMGYLALARVPDDAEWDLARSLALTWALVCLGLLAFGHAVAWAFRGFQREGKS